MVETINKVRKVARILYQNPNLVVEETAEELAMTPEKVKGILKTAMDPISLRLLKWRK